MRVPGEVYCLACGRYLADVGEHPDRSLRLVPTPGSTRPHAILRSGRPYCRHCGGRAVVEYEPVQRQVLEPALLLDPRKAVARS